MWQSIMNPTGSTNSDRIDLVDLQGDVPKQNEPDRIHQLWLDRSRSSISPCDADLGRWASYAALISADAPDFSCDRWWVGLRPGHRPDNPPQRTSPGCWDRRVIQTTDQTNYREKKEEEKSANNGSYIDYIEKKKKRIALTEGVSVRQIQRSARSTHS